MKRAVFALLKRGTVEIELLPIKDWGECDSDEKTLIIRRSLCEKNKVRVLIHESLHYLRTSWTEEQVLKREEEIYSSLTKAEYDFLKEFVHG